jgi:nucleotide-binding universal stress UspA family protein
VTREPRILHATSGSLAARAATVVAAELAAGFEAQLITVHVIVAENCRVGRMAPTLPITRRLDDPYTDPVLLDARRVAWARGVSTELALIAGDSLMSSRPS